MQTIRLEYIGENSESECAHYYKSVRNLLGREVADSLIGNKRPRMPWVAHITGKDPKFRFKRNFLKSKWQRRDANSKQSRGVILEFKIEENKLYQVNGFTSWRCRDQYFCVLNGKSIIRLTEEEALEWLEDN